MIASGGVGFLWLARDVDPAVDGLIGLLRRPTHDYTILPPGPLRWGNLAVTMLIPQRSFLLGLPLFLIVGDAVVAGGDGRGPRAGRAGGCWPAGAITGLMPLAHAHAFTVAMAIGVALALLFPDLRGVVAIAGAGGRCWPLPQILLLATGSSMQSRQFLGWQVGWDRGDLGLLQFWWLNLGFFIPALLAAVLWRGPEARGRRPPAALLRCRSALLPGAEPAAALPLDLGQHQVPRLVAPRLGAVLVALLLARLWRLGGWARAAGGGRCSSS